MSISANELYNAILDCGIAKSPAAELYLEQALEIFVGRRFDSVEFVFELLAESDWTPEAVKRIQAAAEAYDGKKIHSVARSFDIKEHIKAAILNDNDRWSLTQEQKQSIVSDPSLIQRWASEYSLEEGFQSLLNNVMDDEIYEWKQAHPAKPSLAEIISSAEQRKGRGEDAEGKEPGSERLST